MNEQFFGRTFWITCAGLTALFLAAFFALHTPVEAILLMVIGCAVLLITMHRLEYGLCIALAELIATSHGHLLSFGPVSLRMAIFVAVLFAWLTHLIRGKRVQLTDPILRPYVLLLIAVGVGTFVGFRSHITGSMMDVINDGNGYLYLLYILPVLTVHWQVTTKKMLLQVFAAASTFVSVLTLLILYLFTHMSEPVQRILYTFFRDARVAELTKVVGDIFRVFLQAQFFDVVLLLVLLAASFWFWKKERDQNILALWIILTISTLVISLSRSFWVGLIAGCATLAVCVLIIKRPSGKEIIIKKAAGALMAVTALCLLWIVLAFPFPRPANISGFGGLLSDRTTDGSDAAISSRWNLLPEMHQVIAEAPILGSGFGKIVAFESDDPRVRQLYPDGKWRTYSFEWGWQDLWLKMGILGPIAFIWLGIFVGRGLIRGFRQENGWLSIGLFAGLVALYATHVFSPYLNHPIGLGYLVFLTPFLVRQTVEKKKMITESIGDHNPVQIPHTALASSLRVEPQE